MPVSHFGLPQQSGTTATVPDAAAAARIDTVIAIFALGVVLGWLIGGGA